MDADKLVIVLTGATNGIGKTAAIKFASSERVGLLILGNRKRELGLALADQLNAPKSAKVQHEDLDLASLESVRAFVKRVSEITDRVDVLVCNGGHGNLEGLTVDGFELQFGVNTLSHHLMTRLLEPLLLKAKSTPENTFPRVVNVSSEGSFTSKGPRFDMIKPDGPPATPAGFGELFMRYADSKLAQIMLARHMSKLVNGKSESPKIATLALHPGFVWTAGFKNAPNWVQWLLPVVWVFLRPFGAILTDEEGCAQTVQCALDSDADLKAAYEKGLTKATPEQRSVVGEWWEGSYWDAGIGKLPNPISLDEKACVELWDKCEEWTRV